MIPSFPYGSLRNVKLLVFTGMICFSLGYSAKGKKNIHVGFRDIIGDTVQMGFKGKLIITVINEPACTGCKVNLLEHMKTEKVRQLYLLDWQYDIVNRKTYKEYIRGLNDDAIEAYPLANEKTCFMLNDSLIYLERESSPYQLWISKGKNGLNIRKIDYKDIFESIHIRKSYLDKLRNF